MNPFAITGHAATCQRCDSDLWRGICLNCSTQRITPTHCVCEICGNSFALDDDCEPLAFCDPCFEKAVKAAFYQHSRHYEARA